jgi:predicted dehydrogenase
MRLREGWSPTPGSAVSLQDAVEIRQLEAPEGDALRMELEGFVHAVRGERSPGVSGAEGRAALSLALSVTEAVQKFHRTR